MDCFICWNIRDCPPLFFPFYECFGSSFLVCGAQNLDCAQVVGVLGVRGNCWTMLGSAQALIFLLVSALLNNLEFSPLF